MGYTPPTNINCNFKITSFSPSDKGEIHFSLIGDTIPIGAVSIWDGEDIIYAAICDPDDELITYTPLRIKLPDEKIGAIELVPDFSSEAIPIRINTESGVMAWKKVPLQYWESITGCESNPTGNPIGGGDGYSDIFISDMLDEDAYTVTRITYNPTDNTVARDALKTALAIAGTVEKPHLIYIPGNAIIDFTYDTESHMGNLVAANVIVASDRGFQGSSGALLKIEPNYDEPLISNVNRSILHTNGLNIRFTGIRLSGGIFSRDDYISYRENSNINPELRKNWVTEGIRIRYEHCEIDNCIISGFGMQCIRIQPFNYYDVWSGEINIHHNILSDAWSDGLGYGVSTERHTLITANHIYGMRHAVASSGQYHASYIASYNLVDDQYASAFDMHQDVRNHEWGGGAIYIHHNTINVSQYAPFRQRGRPRIGVWYCYNKSYYKSPYDGGVLAQHFEDGVHKYYRPKGVGHLNNNTMYTNDEYPFVDYCLWRRTTDANSTDFENQILPPYGKVYAYNNLCQDTFYSQTPIYRSRSWNWNNVPFVEVYPPPEPMSLDYEQDSDYVACMTCGDQATCPSCDT